MRTSNLKDFIREHSLTMRVERAPSNPNATPGMWDARARHWRFVIVSGNGAASLRGYYSQGSAHTKPPTLAEVMECLASDAYGYEQARSFAEWANEYGYDSRTAERTYNLVKGEAMALAEMLGADAYDQLLYHTDRE